MPFSGSGTTLISAFRLRRQAIACELSAEFVTLSLRRLCSNLVQVQVSVACVHFSVDPPSDPMDRSSSTGTLACASVDSQLSTVNSVPRQLQLVQQERRFYFIGRENRTVIFSVLADSLEDARQQFRNSGHPDSAALFIIKTETEIYLA